MATKQQLFNYIKNLYNDNLKDEKASAMRYYHAEKCYTHNGGLDGVKYYLKLMGYKTINARTFNALKDSQKELYIINHVEKESVKKCAETCEKIDDILSAADFKKLEIKTDWVKSYTWGFNPHAAAWCLTSNGWENSRGSASGCGYDKISAAYNTCLREFKSIYKLLYIMLLNKWDGASNIGRNNPLPYGVYMGRDGLYLALNGCGLSSVVNALEWCGLKVETIGGKSWDYLKAEK